MKNRYSVCFFALLAFVIMVTDAIGAGAIASIPGYGENNEVSYGFATVKAAKAKAIEGCKKNAARKGFKGSCIIVLSNEGPGYLSIAHGDNGAGYGYAATSQEAVDTAANACEKSYKNCQTENIKYWEDNPEPESSPKISSCRPNTEIVRCRSQCTNGNCLVSYENGCKVRVQVAPSFDPASNQWVYPSPAC